LSRCYLDTNFLYAHLRSERGRTLGPVETWRARVLNELDDDAGLISALVLDELAYRLVLAWLRDDGDDDPLSTYRANGRQTMRATRRRLTATWGAVDSLGLELQPTEHAVVTTAKSLMSQPGLAPRDAFHAAHALAAGCELIASSDPGFDGISNLKRVAP
jgi:predicted nucleic acid-binding protein